MPSVPQNLHCKHELAKVHFHHANLKETTLLGYCHYKNIQPFERVVFKKAVLKVIHELQVIWHDCSHTVTRTSPFAVRLDSFLRSLLHAVYIIDFHCYSHFFLCSSTVNVIFATASKRPLALYWLAVQDLRRFYAFLGLNWSWLALITVQWSGKWLLTDHL